MAVWLHRRCRVQSLVPVSVKDTSYFESFLRRNTGRFATALHSRGLFWGAPPTHTPTTTTNNNIAELHCMVCFLFEIAWGKLSRGR